MPFKIISIIQNIKQELNRKRMRKGFSWAFSSMYFDKLSAAEIEACYDSPFYGKSAFNDGCMIAVNYAVENNLIADDRFKIPHMLNWQWRARVCAKEIIEDLLDDVKPERDECGMTMNHIRWMCDQIVDGKIESETKACRWLGYIQAFLIIYNKSNLEIEKQRNLNPKERLA